MKLRVGFAMLIGLVGIWQLSAAGWIHAKAWLAERLIASAWESSLRSDQRIPPWPWADTAPVARLEVPRLGLSRYVLAGGQGRTLAFGPGWLQGTAQPGRQGKSVVSGHRDTHFRFLRELRLNDRLLIHTADGNQVVYRVSRMQVQSAEAIWLLAPGFLQQLVLVTCYPFDALLPGTERRYVVTAEAEPEALELNRPEKNLSSAD